MRSIVNTILIKDKLICCGPLVPIGTKNVELIFSLNSNALTRIGTNKFYGKSIFIVI